MQFKVGDRVVHPTYGIGTIATIEEREFSDKGPHLYYQVILARSTLWIPVKAPGDTGLRLATTESELEQYRHVLKSPALPLSQNHAQRRLDLIDRLKQGSFQGMCEVVRDLTARGRQQTLGATDNATLQKTRDSLYQEWATAAGIAITEATKEVETLLRLTGGATHQVI